MKNIISIQSSIMGDQSVSRRLSGTIIGKILLENPSAEVRTLDLVSDELPSSEILIDDIKQADYMVIAVPLYNFGIPDKLKTYIDAIIRPGLSFNYIDGRPVGLLGEVKIILAFAAGGVYSEGIMAEYDFAEPYLRKVFGFIGLTDITTFRAEGLKVPGILETAIDKVESEVAAHAF